MQLIITLAVLCLFVPLVFSETCGDTGKRCIEGRSECIDGKCECVGKFVNGTPNFNCYKKNKFYAEVKKDPTLLNYNNELIAFPYSCRYLLTHVHLNLRNKYKQIIGSVELMVHGFNAKHKGKIYPAGFDVALNISYDNGTDYLFSVRKYGTTENGNVMITHKGTAGEYRIDGPYDEDDVTFSDDANGIYVKDYFDAANDQHIYECIRCGFHIFLRPFDTVLEHNQPIVPGISVAINCVYRPGFLSPDRVLATGPAAHEGGLSFFDPVNYLLPGLTPVQTNIVRAFRSAVAQTQPDAALNCAVLTHTFLSCPDGTLNNAMNSCYWMIQKPKLVKCVDKTTSSNDILNIINKCAKKWCTGIGQCFEAIGLIEATNCNSMLNPSSPALSPLDGFLDGCLCPPPERPLPPTCPALPPP